jgi:diadenosine tetraphosphate (Ap4A) HIT family hydrolase
MPNPTMVKFGHPATLVAETARWSVLLRPQQPTLGSLVLVCREEARAFGDLSPEAFADLKAAVAGIERMLKSFVAFERINYLMLMMVDPDVHFHVIPRYGEARRFGETDFPDAGWPGPPVLAEAVTPAANDAAAIRDRLAALWSGI